MEVAAHGEHFGNEMPCLLIAAKDDLEPDPACISSSARVRFLLLVEVQMAACRKESFGQFDYNSFLLFTPELPVDVYRISVIFFSL